ncbi:hypothetical protein [Sulfurimonas sp. HSL3-7]|uniref:hypothetical protein n=1 Tax=Sulfonitrofixus jiaomeiensis TaxID=3131938 RepID=UPI0031F9AEAB
MNICKKLALSFLLAAPMVASAAGMGVYVPISVANSSSVTNDSNGDVDTDYSPSAGFGVAFDSNIGKDRLFNYRLGLEYMNAKIDTTDSRYEEDFARFNIVNTFGFGVLRTKVVRLWVGPRVNIAWNWRTDDPYDYTEAAFELGIAPAVGVNVNLGPVVSLGADLDYRFAYVAGAWENDLDDDTYDGSVNGLTARFYVLFRFGETFDRPAPQSAVDSSL